MFTIAPKVREKVASGGARSGAKCGTAGIESVGAGTLKGRQRRIKTPELMVQCLSLFQSSPFAHEPIQGFALAAAHASPLATF
ncbi:MAG TPA: hypothetical protein VLB68_27390 [Pyrinomonadaceae bacterium]|nr:hypothetical protein [Pyrinomonadaceae bacterium]